MKRLASVVFFLITSLICDAQLQEFFTVKKIIVGEQHKDDPTLERYLFNYEMDGACVKQGDFSTWFLSDISTNNTTLVATGKYKDGYLYDTCRWFFVGTEILYMQVIFADAPEDADKFTVLYSGKAFCDKGSKEGVLSIYYLTSKLKEQAVYVKNKSNGIYEGFYENGKTAFKFEFVNGVQNGFYENYDERGYIINKGYVNPETHECYMEEYSDRSSFKTRIMKTKNELPVYDSSIYKNKQLHYRTYYTGKLIDSSFEFYYKGQRMKEEVYDAEGNGYLKKYYDNGNLKESATYKNRLLEGTSLSYYKNGNKKSEKNYSAGLLNGKFTEWYETGILKLEEKYVNNKPDSYKRVYYENGKLSSSSSFSYSNGLKSGIDKTFDSNGQLTEERIYKNGLTVSQKFFKNGKEFDPRGQEFSTAEPMGKGDGMLASTHIKNEIPIQSDKDAGYGRRDIKHEILYKSKQDLDCSAFSEIKPIFNKDTFVSHFQQYLTTSEGKCLKKISKEVDFYITTTENTTALTAKYSRGINNVIYHTRLNKKQQNAFTQFLLNEKLTYDTADLMNIIYKLSYELSIIPSAFNK